jgi:hypothetical protein
MGCLWVEQFHHIELQQKWKYGNGDYLENC